MTLKTSNKVILPSAYALPVLFCFGGGGGGGGIISSALQPWRQYTAPLLDSYNFLKDTTPSTNVRQLAHSAKLFEIYKVTLANLIFKKNFQLAPPCMEFITKRRSTTHNLRNANNLAIPFSNSYYMKTLLCTEMPSSGIPFHRLQEVEKSKPSQKLVLAIFRS